MNTTTRSARWVPALGALLLLAARGAPAAVSMVGEVTLDYYVAEVDGDGFEWVDAELYAERIDNDASARTGPLSLAGWATDDVSPTGAGTEIGYLPIGAVAARSSLHDVYGTAPADDLPPGEYYAHVLLQDDDFPGTWEDARTLSPRLLWRGGLEAVGPLTVYVYAGGHEVGVDFAELRNNRLDGRFTNDIRLTLYATYGYGPASDGYVLCETTVRGLHAGDYRHAPGFDCALRAIPNGDYTLHLDVAEIGGRGGYSTLSGPDMTFRDGIAGGRDTTVVVHAGGLGALLIIVFALAALARSIAPMGRSYGGIRLSGAGLG